MTDSKFYHPGITTGAATDLFSDIAEQFRYSFFILKLAENYPALVSGVFLSFGNKRFNVSAKRFCFGERGNDPLVSDQFAGHVA